MGCGVDDGLYGHFSPLYLLWRTICPASGYLLADDDGEAINLDDL